VQEVLMEVQEESLPFLL